MRIDRLMISGDSMDAMDREDPFKVPTSTASREKSHMLEIAPAILPRCASRD
jgi:hypothetical protein